jgi:hypothetical protein
MSRKWRNLFEELETNMSYNTIAVGHKEPVQENLPGKFVHEMQEPVQLQEHVPLPERVQENRTNEPNQENLVTSSEGDSLTLPRLSSCFFFSSL